MYYYCLLNVSNIASLLFCYRASHLYIKLSGADLHGQEPVAGRGPCWWSLTGSRLSVFEALSQVRRLTSPCRRFFLLLISTSA